MTTLFISDLHLDRSRPSATETFLEFLNGAARNADSLYILGDLFEAWLGDDAANDHDRRVIDALRSYTSAGHAAFFIHGNRDFLIGEEFARQSGVTILPAKQLIELGNEAVLIMHGDELCTSDVEYQRYRRIVRHSLSRTIAGALPRSTRRWLARQLRSASRKRTPLKPENITDVTQAAVEQNMRKFKVRTLVHGHTHRPAIHEFSMDGANARRIVLGDWYQHGSVLSWNAGEFSVSQLSW